MRVVLIGFSGSGKSSIARMLSTRLGWRLVDTDADIENKLGITVPEIFASKGESYFREIEREALLEGLSSDHAVIATGGGAVVDPAIWNETLLRKASTLVISLDSEPETILARLQAQHAAEGSAVERPMITGDDPLSRIKTLKARRLETYDQADITLITEGSSPESLVDEIAQFVSLQQRRSEPTLKLRATSASSDIFLRSGLLASIGELGRRYWPNARKVWVISDETVAAIHGESVVASLSESGYLTNLMAVAVGEGSKSWSTCGELLDWMLDGGIERGDLVVALGGGVIGDLAGFAAASVLRGVPLMQVPTSLLAMVDSSIGGKTGINHRTGKNLIGAFYQPPVVLIDPNLLMTLPPRELTAGWAEVIKHAVIQQSTPDGERGDLLAFLERNISSLRALNNPAIAYAIERNVSLKARVVAADEKEQGIRAYLNFGHTIGHAIEASDYRLLHGEAVGIGMRAAMRIALLMGTTTQSLVDRVDALIAAFGLPDSTKVDETLVFSKMGSDKKRVAGLQRWVLPLSAGGVGVRCDVPESVVLAALREVTMTSSRHQ